MSTALYEVAAVTPYTDNCGADKYEVRAVQAANTGSCTPVNAFSAADHFGWHQNGSYRSSSCEGSAATLSGISTLNNSSDAVVHTDSSSSVLSDNCIVSQPSNSVEHYGQSQSQICQKADSCCTSQAQNVGSIRHQAKTQSSDIWLSKPGFGMNKEEVNDGVQFAQPMSSNVESVGSWVEASASQRELSTSDWWGEISMGTSISQGSNMGDAPLLASTMLESENEYSTHSEIVDAVRKVNSKKDCVNPTPLVATGMEKDATYSGSDFHAIELKDNTNISLKHPCLLLENINDMEVDRDKAINNDLFHFAKTKSNFLETKGAENLHPNLEKSLQKVANQLCALQNSTTPALSEDPPKTKSYRDVLLGTSSSVTIDSARDHTQTAVSTVECNSRTNEAMPSLTNANAHFSIQLNTREDGSIKKNTPNYAIQSNANSSMNLLQTQIEEIPVKKNENTEPRRGQVENDWQKDNFYTSNTSTGSLFNDTSLVTASDSNLELYYTALSRLQGTDQDSSIISHNVDKTEADSQRLGDRNADQSELHRVSYDENGNLADVECSWETDKSVESSDDGCSRGRMRRRLLHKQALRSDRHIKTSFRDEESTSNGSDLPASKFRPGLMPIFSVNGQSDTTSLDLLLSDDCPSVRSSSTESCKSSDSRPSSSNSCSSSLSTSSSSSSSTSSSTTRVEITTKLNPECPPFVPKAARLRDPDGETSSSTASNFPSNGSQTIHDKPCSLLSQDSNKEIDCRKSLDVSLMPPPLTTKVPGTAGNQLRRIQQLRLSTTDSGISSSVDTTSHCNTSANTTHGGGQILAVPTIHDGHKHHVDVMENVDNDVFSTTDVSHQTEDDRHGSTNSTSERSSFATCLSHSESSTSQQTYREKFCDRDNSGCNNENDFLLHKVNKAFLRCLDEAHIVHASPYRCGIQHQSDFVPILNIFEYVEPQTYQSSVLPGEILTPTNAQALLSISQRVVRLRVKKPLMLQYPTTPELAEQRDSRPEYDHYGTGFVFSVNRDYFHVRTHEAVVGSAEEAAKAEIAFELLLPGTRQTHLVSCNVNKDSALDKSVEDFSSHTHSQVTSFRCLTPRELIPWLHLFEPVPVKIRNSLFEDSCYFSDFSPENSITDDKDSDFQTKDFRSLSKSSSYCKTREFASIAQGTSFGMDNGEENLSFDAFQPKDLEKSEYNSYPCSVFLQIVKDKEKICPQVTNLFDQKESSNYESFSWDKMVKETGEMAIGITNYDSKFSVRDNIRENSGRWQRQSREGVINVESDENRFSLLNHIPTSGSTYNMSYKQKSDNNWSKCSHHLNYNNLQEKTSHDNPEVCGINISTRSFDVSSKTSDYRHFAQFQTNVANKNDVGGGRVALTRDGSRAFPGRQDTQWRNENQSALEQADPMLQCQSQLLVSRSSGCVHTPDRYIHREVRRARRFEEDGRPSSPLVIMERRAAAEGRSTLFGVGQCPYGGTSLFGQSGQYTYFSSYGSDVIDSMREVFTSESRQRNSLDNTAPNLSGSGEYESLLYAQNGHRSTYDHQHRPGLARNTQRETETDGEEKDSNDSVFLREQREDDPGFERNVTNKSESSSLFSLEDGESASAGGDAKAKGERDTDSTSRGLRDFRLRTHRGDCDKTAVRRKFAPTDPFKDLDTWEKYVSTWNIDLLNLNSDLTPQPDFRSVASTLAYVFDEVDPYNKSCCLPSAAENGATGSLSRPYSTSDPLSADTRAVIISHPHGGNKMVSSGFFSRHYHVGGNLYDTPTCMGSCGAPVISLAGDGSELYVTHLVHSGIIGVNGIATGMGVASFQI